MEGGGHAKEMIFKVEYIREFEAIFKSGSG
jgi:hypothetical protein